MQPPLFKTTTFTPTAQVSTVKPMTVIKVSTTYGMMFYQTFTYSLIKRQYLAIQYAFYFGLLKPKNDFY
jgi:hypothetical protein